MANKKIYELEELTTPSANDLFLVNQASTSKDKKVKMQNLVPYDTMVSIITSILEAHPEWTTTVEDGSIDIDKLATDTLALINSKAETDGYYEDMAVGSAEQLLSNTFETDKSPYLYRTSGGSLEIGDRVYEDAIVGGSMPWNQRIVDGNFPSTNNWNFASSTVSASNNELTVTATNKESGQSVYTKNEVSTVWAVNHKILATVDIKSNASIRAIRISLANNTITKNAIGNIVPTSTWQKISGICNISEETRGMRIGNVYPSDMEVGDTYVLRNVMAIDLTLALGSTIADYAYALEQSEAGSGIAWLKSQGFFSKDYYAYNAGGIESVKTSAKKVVGFNQWDEQWEVGSLYYETGLPYNANNRIRSKYFKCLPLTTYCWSCKSGLINMIMFEYDKEQNMISRVVSITAQHGIFTTSNNTSYLRFYLPESYGAIYNHDICINFHWDGEKDGEYEPYVEHTYPLDSDLELRGIPQLVDDKIKYDGDTYASDGTVTRRYGIVDLGTLTWVSSGTNVFAATLSGLLVGRTGISPLICAKYTTQNISDVNSNVDKSIWQYYNTSNIRVYDSTYTDAATFKTAMSGVYLVYELATPTTESADPYTNPQWVSNWGTEQFVDERDVPVPVGHDSRYLPDLKAKVESAPNNPSTNGKYFLQYQNGEATYVPVPSEVPQTPSEDGTYVLKATVSGGTATLSWVAEE